MHLATTTFKLKRRSGAPKHGFSREAPGRGSWAGVELHSVEEAMAKIFLLLRLRITAQSQLPGCCSTSPPGGNGADGNHEGGA